MFLFQFRSPHILWLNVVSCFKTGGGEDPFQLTKQLAVRALMRSLIAAVADHRDEISASVIELLLEASADQTGLTEVTEELRSSVIDEIMARASKEGILLIRSMKFDERGNTVGYQFHICS